MIRVTVVGEKGVGKTTLISTYVNSSFSPFVGLVAPPQCVQGQQGMHEVIDTSSRACNAESVEEAIHVADVVMLLFVSLEESRVERWLNRIRTAKKSFVPVVLVHTKMDLSSSEANARELAHGVSPLLLKFPEIETMIPLSALQVADVNEAFFVALRVANYPLNPIFDRAKNSLSDQGKFAVQRIFRIIDSDNRGYISDQQFSSFQTEVFGSGIFFDHISKLKHRIEQTTIGGYVEGQGISILGFEFLILLFITDGSIDLAWLVFTHYGYDRALSLAKDFMSPCFNVRDDECVTLSAEGERFLAQWFKSMDVTGSGFVSREKWEGLFSVYGCEIPPFGIDDTVVTEAGLCLDSFLALWHMWAMREPLLVLKWFKILGFLNAEDGLAAWKRKKRYPNRNAFRIAVVGAPGSGKRSLLSTFLKRPLFDGQAEKSKMTNDGDGGEDLVCYGVRSVDTTIPRPERPTYIVLECRNPDPKLVESKEIEQYDVVVMIFDSSSAASFEPLVILQDRMMDLRLLTVYVASKAELPPAREETFAPLEIPSRFASSRGLPTPELFSAYVCNSSSMPTVDGPEHEDGEGRKEDDEVEKLRESLMNTSGPKLFERLGRVAAARTPSCIPRFEPVSHSTLVGASAVTAATGLAGLVVATGVVSALLFSRSRRR